MIAFSEEIRLRNVRPSQWCMHSRVLMQTHTRTHTLPHTLVHAMGTMRTYTHTWTRTIATGRAWFGNCFGCVFNKSFFSCPSRHQRNAKQCPKVNMAAAERLKIATRTLLMSHVMQFTPENSYYYPNSHHGRFSPPYCSSLCISSGCRLRPFKIKRRMMGIWLNFFRRGWMNCCCTIGRLSTWGRLIRCRVADD